MQRVAIASPQELIDNGWTAIRSLPFGFGLVGLSQPDARPCAIVVDELGTGGFGMKRSTPGRVDGFVEREVWNMSGEGSLRLDVRCPDHLGPFRKLDFDLLGEFLRCTPNRIEAKRYQAFLYVWPAHAACHSGPAAELAPARQGKSSYGPRPSSRLPSPRCCTVYVQGRGRATGVTFRPSDVLATPAPP
jgi:hypothetical protein